MPFELTIQEGRWSLRRLGAFLEAWGERESPRVLRTTPWATSRTGARVHLFAEGSTRGCSLRLKTSLVKGSGLVLRLGALASRADGALAFALARGLLKAGGGRAVGPDGRVLRAEDMSEASVLAAARARFRSDLGAVRRELERGSPFAALPCPHFSLILTAAMLPPEGDADRSAGITEGHLQQMAARYVAAEVVAPLRLPDGTTLSVWGRNAALLFLVNHLGVQHEGHDSGGFVVPVAQAIQLLGTRPELVSERRDRFYLPALLPGKAEDQALVTALEAAGEPLETFMARYQKREESIF